MAPRIPDAIECDTESALHHEVRIVRDGLSLEESEESWEKIAFAIQHLSAVINGSAPTFTRELVDLVKGFSRPINNALNSERSRLSGSTTDLITTLAIAFKKTFEPLLPHFIPTLLTLATRTSKIFISRAKSCLLAIAENTQLPSLLSYLRNAVADKSTSLRLVATEVVLACLNCYNPPDIETTARAEDVEAVIRSTARDASAEVRKNSRLIFEAYSILLPNRIDAFIGPLTPVMKKYLDIKGKPTANASTGLASSKRAIALSTLSSSMPVCPVAKLTNVASSIRKAEHSKSSSSGSHDMLHMGQESGGTVVSANNGRPRLVDKANFRPLPAGPIRPPPSLRHTIAPSKPIQASSDNRAPARPVPIPRAPKSAVTDAWQEHKTGKIGKLGGAQRPTVVSVPTVNLAQEHTKSTELSKPSKIQTIGSRSGASSMASLSSGLTTSSTAKDTADSGPRRVPKEIVTNVNPVIRRKEVMPASTTRQGNRSKLAVDGMEQVPIDSVEQKLGSHGQKPHVSVGERGSNSSSSPDPAGFGKMTSQGQNARTQAPGPSEQNQRKASSRPGLLAPTISQMAKIKDAVRPSVTKNESKNTASTMKPTKPLAVRKANMFSVDMRRPRPIAVGENYVRQPVVDLPLHLESTLTPSATQYIDNSVSQGAEVPQELDARLEITICPVPADIPLPRSPELLPNRESRVVQLPMPPLPTPPRHNLHSSQFQVAATPISALLFTIHRGFDFDQTRDGTETDTTLAFSQPNETAISSVDGLDGIDFPIQDVDEFSSVDKSPGKLRLERANRIPLALRNDN